MDAAETYVPQSRTEEILLLLLITEALVRRETENLSLFQRRKQTSMTDNILKYSAELSCNLAENLNLIGEIVEWCVANGGIKIKVLIMRGVKLETIGELAEMRI